MGGTLADNACVNSTSGNTVNGHLAKVHALTVAEQDRAVEKASEILGPRNVPVITGVRGESSLEAGRMAA